LSRVAHRPRLTLVALPDIANKDNLGALVRISAAFGADALVVGEHSCDLFWRQAVRVSMGTIFSLPVVRSVDLLADLRALRECWGVELAAAVVGGGAEPLDALLSRVAHRPRLTLVALPDIANTDNLGALVRISAAFGADALVVGERSCDPFWRQSVRVSMGTIFSLPLVRSADLLEDLRGVREQWGVELAAAVVGGGAEPLERAGRGERLGLLFGNEAQGLSPEYVAACDRRVTIPMQLGTDSLNVAVAAAVFLYHFTREA
jgi:tRNA G18 (ribose-2'-O)-methylase SpoU